MKFRPCIDIHNGCVKQIVGGSLADKIPLPMRISFQNTAADIMRSFIKAGDYQGDISLF